MKSVQLLVLVSFLLLLAVIFTFVPAKASDIIKVMVIDTGVVKDHPALKNYNAISFSPDDTKFDNEHGTEIASLVMNGILNDMNMPQTPVCNRVQLYICNYKPDNDSSGLFGCLDKALVLKMNFVNYSSVGPAFVPGEYARIYALSEIGTKFITAAGNEGDSMIDYPKFPAMYNVTNKLKYPFNRVKAIKNVIIVGALTSTGSRWDLSNYGVPMKMEPGVNIRTAYVFGIGQAVTGYGSALSTGTSISTALYTNRLLREKCEEKK